MSKPPLHKTKGGEMAIRFDPKYNAEIRRIVHNFNQKRNRAIKRGFTHLPPALTVSELKSRYTKRADLERDLRLIKRFNREDALESVVTSGGVKAINWEVKYLKANIKRAKEFYDREIRNLSFLDTDLVVSKKEVLNNLREKRAYLDLELDLIAPNQYSTYKSIINEYLSSNYDRQRSYRAWMNEVEIIMSRLGYDKKTINQFFKGFDQLTPNQFVNMYRQNSIVSRIYELYIPKTNGTWDLSTSEEDAKELIDTFMVEKDEMINKAKLSEGLGTAALDEFSKSLKDYKVPRKENTKLKRENLTAKEIKQLEELGWDDIIE